MHPARKLDFRGNRYGEGGPRRAPPRNPHFLSPVVYGESSEGAPCERRPLKFVLVVCSGVDDRTVYSPIA